MADTGPDPLVADSESIRACRSLSEIPPSSPRRKRQAAEYKVEEVLGAQGAVIGAGSGFGITNLDLELPAAQPNNVLLETLDTAVEHLGLPGAFWQWERSTDKHPVGSGLSGPGASAS